MTRIPSVLAAAILGLGTFSGASPTGQPEVNNPPEIKEFSFNFGVKAGNIMGIDTSEARACTRVKVNFEVTVHDYEGDLVTVTMDLDGDKKLDDAKRKVKGAGTVVASNTYSKVGPVQLRFRACDSKGACSSEMRTDFDVVTCPPQIHEIHSKIEEGDLTKTVHLELLARDVQDDKVYWEVDFDEDMLFEIKTKPAPPTKKVELEHTYLDRIKHWCYIRVCDAKDGCSETEERKF